MKNITVNSVTGCQTVWAVFLMLCILSHSAYAQSTPTISSVEIGGGSVVAKIDSPVGELIVHSSEDLQPDNWTQLSRLVGDGSTVNFDDPYDPNVLSKFYRVYAVPPADETHLSGNFSIALQTALSFSNLQAAFALNFPEGDATIPAGNDLSFSTRNARIYSAIIASLSKLAEGLSDGFPAGSKPSASTIAAALANDLSDGTLDGNNNESPVQIGTTGFFLPAYTEQDFLDALNDIKATIPGLYNVFFTASGTTPAAFSSSGAHSVQPASVTGTFTPSTPAKWGDFYWGSSDWQ